MTHKALNLPQNNHLFFDRFGGVSTDKYSSLNVNYKSQDSKQNLEENLKIIAKKFNVSINDIFFPLQTHSADAVFAKTPSIRDIQADGCVTDNPNILLLITTADCIPVLFHDKVSGLVGAAHSGWPGSLKGVCQNTIDLMIKHGSKPQDINIAIGPCLQQKSFETKEDLYQKFIDQNQENAKFFTKKEEGYLFDHVAYLISQIKRKGITNISISDIDTYTNLDYFSFRRNTHQGLITQDGDFAVQASVIKL